MNDLLTELLAEESRLQFAYFNHQRAWELGCALKEAAEQLNASVAIDITVNNQCLFSYAMHNTTIDNLEWIRRKRNVVHRYQHSSWYMGNYYKAKESTIENSALIDPREFAPYGGSFPLTIRNTGVIGAISVSGLPQKEDHRLIVNVLERFLDPHETQENCA
ncbi:heme-degrading domain-containing protein [Photobacterium alginatilyticum]|uniref:UPF0303 protein EIZ48_04160 n=1 Tax=Photobacterium alginatilyticum TaxID=1775171 RepID=A0ABW9YER9_9GAMM|nr:heme-degrading domain-containing protein [Photobacterium alginatilyticum]NBI51771.1 heme-degrading domain-containing protein [Photobacterium alginatilyticum]